MLGITAGCHQLDSDVSGGMSPMKERELEPLHALTLCREDAGQLEEQSVGSEKQRLDCLHFGGQ